MKQHRMCDSLLALLGIIAVAVYVLACRPSFSPDGSKIVFPSFDTDAKQASVLCYDLKAKTLEKIYQSSLVDKVREPEPAPKPDQKKAAEKSPFPFSSDNSKDEYLIAVQWLPDGRRIVINTLSQILILPVGSASPAHLFQLQNVLDSGTLMRPVPVLGKYQIIPDKEFLLRVDLETGEMLAAPDKKEFVLFGQGSELYYIVSADTIGAPEGAESKPESIEIGKLNRETLATTPLLKLIGEEQYGELTGFGAVTRDGNRLALTTKFSKIPKVLLFRDGKLEKALTLAKEDTGITAGNVEWSLDGKALFVAYARETENARCRYGVLEAPVDGSSAREIPLFTANSSESWLATFQVALSPNGRTLAISSTCFEKEEVKNEDRALYLVDLGSAARNVTKVPVPLNRAGNPDKTKK